MTPTLLSSSSERGGLRLVFMQTDEKSGTEYGPFVEQRSAKDDVDAYLGAHGEALAISLAQPQPDEIEILRVQVLRDPVLAKEAFAIDDAKIAEIQALSDAAKVEAVVDTVVP